MAAENFAAFDVRAHDLTYDASAPALSDLATAQIAPRLNDVKIATAPALPPTPEGLCEGVLARAQAAFRAEGSGRPSIILPASGMHAGPVSNARVVSCLASPTDTAVQSHTLKNLIASHACGTITDILAAAAVVPDVAGVASPIDDDVIEAAPSSPPVTDVSDVTVVDLDNSGPVSKVVVHSPLAAL